MQENPQNFGVPRTTMVPQTLLPTIRPAGPSSAVLESRRQKLLASPSLMEMVLGFACIQLGIVEYVKLHFWSKTFASGILVGCVILFAGIFSFFSATRPKSTCLGTVNIISSTISALLSVGEIVIAGLGIAYYKKGLCVPIPSYYYYSYYGSRWYTQCGEYPDLTLGVGIFSTLIFLMIVQVVIAVIAAVYSFKLMSGDTGESPQIQMPLGYYPGNLQPMVPPAYYSPAQPGSMAPYYQIQASQPQVFAQMPYSTSANTTGLVYTTTNGCQAVPQSLANNVQMADVTKTDLAASGAA